MILVRLHEMFDPHSEKCSLRIHLVQDLLDIATKRGRDGRGASDGSDCRDVRVGSDGSDGKDRRNTSRGRADADWGERQEGGA